MWIFFFGISLWEALLWVVQCFFESHLGHFTLEGNIILESHFEGLTLGGKVILDNVFGGLLFNNIKSLCRVYSRGQRNFGKSLCEVSVGFNLPFESDFGVFSLLLAIPFGGCTLGREVIL